MAIASTCTADEPLFSGIICRLDSINELADRAINRLDMIAGRTFGFPPPSPVDPVESPGSSGSQSGSFAEAAMIMLAGLARKLDALDTDLARLDTRI